MSNTQPRASSRTRFALFIPLSVICGGGVALQSRVNGSLAGGLGDGFAAALISFGSGLVVICLVLIFSGVGRRGVRTIVAAVRSGELPWWHTLGGVGGGLFVLSQGLTVGLLGIALFTVATVAGQTISGLLVDRRGIGTVAPKVVTVTRIVGAALALVAVVLAVLSQLSAVAQVWVVIFPFAAGLLLAVQQAVNGQVKTRAKSATTATFFNFVSGTATLLVFAIIHTAIVGFPRTFPTNPVDYVGGILGVLFIAGFAFVIPTIGVLLQSLTAVAGQLLMALLLDFVAPTNAGAVAATTVIGTLLTLVAAGIAVIPSRAVRATKR